MCTAITYHTAHTYFGRTLDAERQYGECVVFTPRRFPLTFRHQPSRNTHHAILGMAAVHDGVPLYFDAINECGLGMAGLLFPLFADYAPCVGDGRDIASFELIPWVLGQCGTVNEARTLLTGARITDTAFRADLPPTPLHWMLADHCEAVVIEQTREGLRLYDNPVQVLTNSPPFEFHLTNLNHYMALSPDSPHNRFAPSLPLCAYSFGMGSLGLPGDNSSVSRFVRAAFTRMNAVSEEESAESIAQFFRILGTVTQVRGCNRLGDAYEITQYTSCADLDSGVYTYTTYDNPAVNAISMRAQDMDGEALVSFPLRKELSIYVQNNG